MASTSSTIPSSLPHIDLDNAPLSGTTWSVIGALSGVLEVCVNQPTVYMKNTLQQRQPLSFSPLVMYRGTFVNAASIAPITAIQFGVSGMAKQFLKERKGSQSAELNAVEQIGSAMLAGAASSIIVCPADMLIIQQQKTGLSLLAQSRQIAQTFGYAKFYRGLMFAAVRESLFTAGYMGLPPVLQKILIQSSPSTFVDPLNTSIRKAELGNWLSVLISNLSSGIIAGFITHPVDTIKTRLQGNLEPNTIYTNIRQTAKLIYAESGLQGFFHGVIPRTGRICIAVLLFQQCNKYMGRQARKWGFAIDESQVLGGHHQAHQKS